MFVKRFVRIAGDPKECCFGSWSSEGDQFASTGSDPDLGRFARLFEAFCEGTQGGVVSAGTERSEVQDTADVAASAGDEAFAALLAAVAVEGSNADQGGDLLAVELAQFGDLGDERHASDRSDAGHALEQLQLVV